MSTSQKYINESNIADLELLELLKKDDKVSFKQIYNKYWSELYIYAFNVLNENDLCEDIIQEIFINLWTRRHKIEIKNLKSYLYKSVKFQIFNNFRRSKYKKQLIEKFDAVLVEFEVYESFEKKETEEEINRLISKLPEQRQIIFKMSRNEGLSNKEISENLEISLQTVKNQISTSLKFIRQSLKIILLLFS